MPGRDLTRLFDQPLAEKDREQFLLELNSANHWALRRACGWDVRQVHLHLQPRHNV